MVLQSLHQMEFNKYMATVMDKTATYLVKSTHQIVPVQIFEIMIAASFILCRKVM